MVITQVQQSRMSEKSFDSEPSLKWGLGVTQGRFHEEKDRERDAELVDRG